MSDLVDPAQIERIVGRPRHPTAHYGRAVSAEQTVYVLHSQQCKDTTPDLRDCPYSLALDQGIDLDLWSEDIPITLAIPISIPYQQLVPDAP